jgi:hypothetical protein
MMSKSHRLSMDDEVVLHLLGLVVPSRRRYRSLKLFTLHEPSTWSKASPEVLMKPHLDFGDVLP